MVLDLSLRSRAISRIILPLIKRSRRQASGKGEYRLLHSVESTQTPITAAVEIAESDDKGVREALQQAYEKSFCAGKKLIAARRLIEERRLRGKHLQHGQG
ncbi:MAG: hypothetical protein ACXWCH_33030 [Burkholderiales bacterium]